MLKVGGKLFTVGQTKEFIIMSKIWQLVSVTAVGLGVGLAIVGCGSSTPTGKDKMGSDKMNTGKMGGDKMSGDEMSGDKMSGDKMGGDKMSADKMSGNKSSGQK
jgi:pentapeptide MXKDX repeat protein